MAGKKSSKGFREKMLGRKKEIARKGVVIDKKDWSKGRIRLLPSHGEDPAKEFKSFYIKEMKKSVTAPCTFGAADPLWSWLDNVYKTGDKAEKQHVKDSVSRSTEYWAPVIVRGDEGTAENPNVRIFRLPYKAYQYVVDLIIDEDYGEDVTDPDEGRDILLKKEGKGVNTEWKPDKMDPEPIVEDEDLYAALVEISESFSVAGHFFPFDFEDYVAGYEAVTGEEFPEEHTAALEELAKTQGENDSSDEEDEEEEDEEEEDEEDEEEEDEEEEDEEMLSDPPEGIEFGETLVSFQVEDDAGNKEDTQGIVQSWALNPDDAEEFLLAIVGEDDDPDDPWLIDVDEVEVIEDTEPEEPDEEETPEEAAPTVRRGKKKKKAKSKKAKSKAAPMSRRPKAATQIRKGSAKRKATGSSKKKKAKAKSSKKATKKVTKKAKSKKTKKGRR